MRQNPERIDIVRFLEITRRPYSIITRASSPAELDGIFKLYDDLLYHFDLEDLNPTDLILTQSAVSYGTTITTSGEPFIILELQEIDRIARITEFFGLHEYDNRSPIATLHALWIEHQDKTEFIAELRLKSGKTVHVPINVTDDAREQLRSPTFYKLASSQLFGPLSSLQGFQKVFEIAVSFTLCHELAHYICKRDPEEAEIKVGYLTRSLPETHRGKGRFLELIMTDDQSNYPGLDNEIFCDLTAIEHARSICMIRHWIDERLFPAFIALMFNAYFAQLAMRGCSDPGRYEELRIRRGFALLFALKAIGYDERTAAWYDEYEVFLGLLDAYSASLAVTLLRSARGGLSPNVRAAMNGYLTFNARDYLPSEVIRRGVQVPDFLDEMERLAKHFCANIEIV